MIEVFLVFTLLVGLLIALLVFISFPSAKRSLRIEETITQRERENLALYDQRCEELAQLKNDGLLDAQGYEQLVYEAKDQLLSETATQAGIHTSAQVDDVNSQNSGVVSGSAQRYTVIFLCLVAALFSLFIYLPGGLSLGANDQFEVRQQLQALQVARAQGAQQPGGVMPEFTELAEMLEAYSQGINPDEQILYLLAQVYRTNGDNRKASGIYQQLLNDDPESSFLLTELAESRYLEMLSGRSSTKPGDFSHISPLLDKALELNPEAPKALSMQGILAFQANDYETALSYWRRALPLFPPNSAEVQTIRQGIQAALSRAGTSTATAQGTPNTTEPAGAEPVNAEPVNESITAWIDVTVKAQLPGDKVNDSISPQTPVFVFARAVSGPPMPLAAKRLRLADLPVTLRLSNLDQMAGIGLDSADRVVVQARLSFSGQPTAASGDIQSARVELDVSTRANNPMAQADAKPTVLIIDQPVP